MGLNLQKQANRGGTPLCITHKILVYKQQLCPQSWETSNNTMNGNRDIFLKKNIMSSTLACSNTLAYHNLARWEASADHLKPLAPKDSATYTGVFTFFIFIFSLKAAGTTRLGDLYRFIYEENKIYFIDAPIVVRMHAQTSSTWMHALKADTNTPLSDWYMH